MGTERSFEFARKAANPWTVLRQEQAGLDTCAASPAARQAHAASPVQGFEGAGAEAFIRHQGELIAVFRSFADRWDWHRLDTSKLSQDEVLVATLGWLKSASDRYLQDRLLAANQDGLKRAGRSAE
ncbi:hypothetical protein ACSMXN_12590 [Jatrophihabitans sp. DSM 45814]